MRVTILSWLAVATTVLLLGGCGCNPKPTLTSVGPPRAYPRQLISVNGSTNLASIVWDAGSTNE